MSSSPRRLECAAAPRSRPGVAPAAEEAIDVVGLGFVTAGRHGFDLPGGANSLKCVSCPNIGPTPVSWTISHWMTS
jgi:hypothetical protein